MIVTDEYTDESRREDAADAAASADTIAADDVAAHDTAAPAQAPQYGVGPFSIREVSLAGAWLIAFIASFFPVYGEIGSGITVWGSGIDWVLTIGVPTVAIFLIVLRRLSPQGIRRVGSLAIDQFASVAFSVATVLWLAIIWNSFVTFLGGRVFAGTWVVWVEFVMMLAGVFLTVLAPFIPPFSEDFVGRAEIPAHRVARPVRAVSPRPAAPIAVASAEAQAPEAPLVYADYTASAESAAEAAAAGQADPAPYWDADGDVVGADSRPGAEAPTAVMSTVTAAEYAESAPERTAEPEPVAEIQPEPEVASEPQSEPAVETPAESEATPETASEPEPTAAPQHQAFWALVPEERDIVDEIGIPVFRIGPTAWALVIEDRGEVFVVRHEDGRIGYLHDVSGVTRG
ncbi:hypothetical protein IF188_03415 [Microbacterium sp. NEAU-LLC]|uniref:Uncharacterized protein n=1 Tax=Microbacterium helvum TaxID=2773713 RepID=A0ABR8NK23_9MICO|nr:hypothetical protein [Microbacterium helvum]MBD3940748.1 hypothetical protein [Microbacterium helvum]